MNIGSYRGAASLAAYEKWQAVTSQNIAASSMPGFKKSDVSFESVAGDVMRTGTRNNAAGGESRGIMAKAATKTNFTQGQLRRTGSDLDFAIQGKGFFQVRQENGEMAYTRDGEFAISPDHKLVTKQGLQVMGNVGPLVLNPGGGVISINSEGTVMQGDQTIGKLAIFDTKDRQSLHRLGEVMFGTQPGEKLDRVDNPAIVNGYVEGSNVSPLAEMVNLITVSRAYEACQKTMTSDGDETDKAIQILGNPQA
ncbi:MAG: flagellar hook basal-body protein [Chthoniobacteraceae bacterium]|nr:flagellar hook basal-body protein [Chthoniobacteraceae bacterium]